MNEFIIINGYYIPPFVRIFFAALGIWLLLRMVYRKPLYASQVFHPAICDLSVLVILILLSTLWFAGHIL